MTTCKIALGIEYDGSGYFGWQRQQRSEERRVGKELRFRESADD